jgi:hypothetical protein
MTVMARKSGPSSSHRSAAEVSGRNISQRHLDGPLLRAMTLGMMAPKNSAAHERRTQEKRNITRAGSP